MTTQDQAHQLAITKPAYSTAVVIGRFQIFHHGHLQLLRQALQQAQQVIVVLGSALQARTPRNPFTWQERGAMINLCLSEAERQRISFLPLRDFYQQELWVSALTQQVNRLLKQQPGAEKVVLLGYNKDFSSDYLHAFPQWDLAEVDYFQGIDAQQLRHILFSNSDLSAALAVLQDYVPAMVRHYLQSWCQLGYFRRLQQEYAFLLKYQQSWAVAPYPPIFNTVDALVRVADQVLLIRRGGYPGKGLWAMPGGFLDPHERIRTAVLRELREETGLAVLPEILQASLQAVQVFDHPQRSQRGRTITHTHYFVLNQENLPEISAADDAAEAVWVAISQLPELEAEFSDDHFQMLNYFLHLNLPDLAPYSA